MVKLIGTTGVAKTLKLSRRDVIRLIDRGELEPAGKLDGVTGAYLFNPADVEAYAATRSQEATA